MRTTPLLACSTCLLLAGPLAGRAPAQTPAPGPYYYMSDRINPNQFPWGLNDRFGGLPIVENLTLLGTLLGDVPVAPFTGVLVPAQTYKFPKPNGADQAITLQPFAYRDAFVLDGPVRALPLGARLRAFLDDPLEGASFDLTLPFVDPSVALSDRSALLRVQTRDGEIVTANDAGVWHTAIDFDHSDDTAIEFEVAAPADGVVAANLVSGCGSSESLALRHTAPNGAEFLTLYGHLDPLSKAHLQVGTAVARGTRLGRLTRNDGGYAHLHFGVAVRGPAGSVDGKRVPPMWYTIDPFGVYDYRRGGSAYTYLPHDTLAAAVQPVRHAYVFRTNPVNASLVSGPPPVAALNQRVTALPGRPRAITLRAAGTDAANVRLRVVTPPARGTLSGTPPHLTYTPGTGFTGRDQFRFRAESSRGQAEATVTIVAPASYTKPAAVARTRKPWANLPHVLPLDGTDLDGDELVVVPGAAPLNGTLVYHGNVACYTPDLNHLGPDSFSYRVSDGITTSGLAAVSLTVQNGFTVGSWSVPEGDSGTRAAPFTVRLLAPNPVDASVEFATASGTANSLDYVPTRGLLLFPAGGATAASVWVSVRGDTRVEPDESFLLKLKNPLGGPLLFPSPAAAAGTGTIRDDDGTAPRAGGDEREP